MRIADFVLIFISARESIFRLIGYFIETSSLRTNSGTGINAGRVTISGINFDQATRDGATWRISRFTVMKDPSASTTLLGNGTTASNDLTSLLASQATGSVDANWMQIPNKVFTIQTQAANSGTTYVRWKIWRLDSYG